MRSYVRTYVPVPENTQQQQRARRAAGLSFFFFGAHSEFARTHAARRRQPRSRAARRAPVRHGRRSSCARNRAWPRRLHAHSCAAGSAAARPCACASWAPRPRAPQGQSRTRALDCRAARTRPGRLHSLGRTRDAWEGREGDLSGAPTCLLDDDMYTQPAGVRTTRRLCPTPSPPSSHATTAASCARNAVARLGTQTHQHQHQHQEQAHRAQLRASPVVHLASRVSRSAFGDSDSAAATACSPARGCAVAGVRCDSGSAASSHRLLSV